MTPRTSLATADTAELRKGGGAFFTPPALAQYVTDWTIRDAGDDVLEPSYGDAVFLLAAAARQRELRGRSRVEVGHLDGVELHVESADSARHRLVVAGAHPRITTGEFLLVEPRPKYDAVVGNPPYMRYQDFSGEARRRSRAAAFQAGVALTNLASSWAAFSIHPALRRSCRADTKGTGS